jgi:hypothetical protein
VRLGGEDDAVLGLHRHESRRRTGALGKDRPNPIAADGARVVPKRDDAVVGVRVERALDEPDQVLGRFRSVDDQSSLEEPVARVLAVGLRDVEALDARGVTADAIAKEVRVVVEIPVVKGEPQLTVDPLQRRAPLGEHRDREHGSRRRTSCKALERARVRALGHAVVHERQKGGRLGIRQWPCARESIPARPLDALHGREPARVADGDRIGGPRRREAHPGADLDDRASTAEERPLRKPLRLERLRQQPAEHGEFLLGQRTVGGDVVAELAIDARNRRAHAGLRPAQEGVTL